MNARKLLSILLAFVMIVSMCPLTAFAAEEAPAASKEKANVAPSEPTAELMGDNITDYPALELDVQTTAVITGGSVTCFRFTPETTCTYFFTSHTDRDTYAYLYDSDMNLLSSDDDGGENLNFGIGYAMEAGQTYVLAVEFLSGDSGSFPVSVTHSSPSYTYTDDPAATCTTDGVRNCVCDCGITWTEVVPAGHSYDNTGTCTVCGEGPTTLEPGVSSNIALHTSNYYFYSFTPETSGMHYIVVNGTNPDILSSVTPVDGYNGFINGNSVYNMIEMEAGVTYEVVLYNYYDTTFVGSITIDRCPAPDSLYGYTTSNSISVGDYCYYYLHFTPEYAHSEITVEISDPTIASATVDSYDSVRIDSLAVGQTEITVSTASGYSDTFTLTVKEIVDLTMGEAATVYLEQDESQTYRFTTDSEGYYAFYVSNSDSHVEVLDIDGSYVGHSGIHAKNGSTYYYYELSADSSYTLSVHNYVQAQDYTVQVNACTTPTTLTLPETVTGTVGSVTSIYAEFDSPWAWAPISWSYEGDCIDFSLNEMRCTLGFNAVGTGSVTVSTTDGTLSATCQVTVEDTPALTPGISHTMTIPIGTSATCSFTSTDAGWYSLDFPNALSIGMTDSDGNYISTSYWTESSRVYLLESNTEYRITIYNHTATDYTLELLIDHPEALAFDGTVSVDVQGEQVQYLSLTTDTSGYYVLHSTDQNMGLGITDDLGSDAYCNSTYEGTERYYLVRLEAGRSYLLQIQNCTGDISFGNCPTPTDMNLGWNTTTMVIGGKCRASVHFFPDYARDSFTVTLSDDSIAQVTCGEEYGTPYIELTGLAAGEVTVTVTTAGGLSASLTFTVVEPTPMILGESQTVELTYDESVVYQFTTGEAGYYAVYTNEEDFNAFLSSASTGDDLYSQATTHSDDGQYIYYYLEANTSYILNLHSWSEYSMTVIVDACTTPTSFSLPASVTGTVGSSIRLTASFGSYWEFADCNWSSGNDKIGCGYNGTSAYITFFAEGSSFITATAQLADGTTLTASTDITILPTPVLTEGEPIDVTIPGSAGLAFKFTPAADGFYGITIADSIGSEISDSDYNALVSHRSSDRDIYLLESGKTYNVSLFSHASNDIPMTAEIAALKSVEPGTLADISAAPDEEFLFSFIPAESGTYYLQTDRNIHCDVLDQDFNYLTTNQIYDTSYKYYTVSLEAGQTYLYNGYNYSGADLSGQLVLGKSGAPESISLGAPATIMVGATGRVDVGFTPVHASEPCTWSVNDPTVAAIVETTDAYCVLEGLTPGSVTVTCTTESGLTESLTLKVREPQSYTLTLDEPLTVTLQSGEYLELTHQFQEAGAYGLLYEDSGLTMEAAYYNVHRNEGDDIALNFTANAGQNVRYLFANNNDSAVTVTFTLATALIPETPQLNRTAAYVSPGNSVYFRVLYNSLQEWDPPVSWTVDNEDVAYISYETSYGACSVMAAAEGTANLTVTTFSGKTFTCPIQVVASNGCELTLNEEAPLRYVGYDATQYTFTPAETGYYAIVIDSPVGGYVAVFNEDYSQYTWKKVEANTPAPLCFHLNGGETYTFSTGAHEEGLFDGTIIVTETVYVTALEITQNPDRMTYVDGYIEQGLELCGLEMNVTWSDGTTTAYAWNEAGVGIGGWNLETLVDEDAGTVTLSCCEGSVDLDVTLTENPITSIEIIDDEIPALVEDAYYSVDVDYYPHVITRKMKLLVTYTDGSTEIMDVNDTIDGYSFRYDSFLYGPSHTTNTITVSILGCSDTYAATFVESPVAGITLVSDPDPLVLGEDSQVIEMDDGSLLLLMDYGCRYEGLTFRIDYTDGTSEVVSFKDLTWPDTEGLANDSVYRLPEYKSYPVEAMHYSEEYYDAFGYRTGSYLADENGEVSMILHYMGSYLTFTVTLEEQTEKTEIASGWSGYTTWSLTDDGTITFSGEGAMKNYTTKDGMPWYSYADQITKVVIEDGITHIGDYAFYGMSNLTRIKIANSVTTIGDYAFKGCAKLDNVVLSNALDKLGDSAFYGCTSLTAIDIPASLWTIKPYTFKNCTALESVTFHEGNLQKISDGAFYGTALKEVTFPDCLSIIDVYAFKGCADLASINLGTGITQIREAVFYGTAIPTITIPEGVTAIHPYAFKNCVNLTSVSLPSTLTSVGEAAFYACTALKSVVLPDAVTTIGNYAFRKCTGLTAVTFGAELVTIGESSFYGCTGLTELVIPAKVTTIQGYAFKGCTGVTAVTLPDSLVTIGDSAFHTCTGIKTIVIPASVETIGEYCFSGSWNLWQITFQGNAPAIGSGAFKGLAATAYYPADNATWTSDIMQNYGGTITWKAK